jgi:hypothetical protein
MSDPVFDLAGRLRTSTVDVDEALDELGRSLIRHAPARRRRRRRRRAGIAATAVAAVLGVAGTAVATGGAHTGRFGLPGFTENDTSEYLDTRAPDFRQVALSYATGVDFAPGYQAEMYLGLLNPALQEAQLPPELADRGIVLQATGVKGNIENWAFCSWIHVSTSDPAALSHMRAIANTPAMAATNQKNSNLRLVEQAASGDTEPLEQYLRINCPSPTPWPAP